MRHLTIIKLNIIFVLFISGISVRSIHAQESDYFSQDWLMIAEDVKGYYSSEEIMQLSTPEIYRNSEVYHPMIAAMYDKFYEIIQRRSVNQEIYPQGLDYEDVLAHTFVLEIEMGEVSDSNMAAMNQLRAQIVAYSLSQEFDRGISPFDQQYYQPANLASDLWRQGVEEMKAIQREDPETFQVLLNLAKVSGIFYPTYVMVLRDFPTITTNRRSIVYRGNSDYSFEYHLEDADFNYGIRNIGRPLDFSFEEFYGVGLEGNLSDKDPELEDVTQQPAFDFDYDAFVNLILENGKFFEAISEDQARAVADDILREIENNPYYYHPIFPIAAQRMVEGILSKHGITTSFAASATIGARAMEYASEILGNYSPIQEVAESAQNYQVDIQGQFIAFTPKGNTGDLAQKEVDFYLDESIVTINGQRYMVEIETIPTIEIPVYKPELGIVEPVKVATKLILNNEALSPHYPFDSQHYYLYYNQSGTLSLAVPNTIANLREKQFDQTVWIEFQAVE